MLISGTRSRLPQQPRVVLLDECHRQQREPLGNLRCLLRSREAEGALMAAPGRCLHKAAASCAGRGIVAGHAGGWGTAAACRLLKPCRRAAIIMAASGEGASPRKQSGAVPAAAEQGGGNNLYHLWQLHSLPVYMQQGNIVEFCKSWEEGVLRADFDNPSLETNLVWLAIRREAERDAAKEPLLSSFLHASILSHTSLERSLAFVLSHRLASPTLQEMELFELFCSVLHQRPEVAEAVVADIRAVHERDPACLSYSHALLHFKGFHSIQTHRIAHELWVRGSRVMALALQSRMSECFAVDIHPGARFGSGILLDHGTGVVIGETVVLGDNVSILHGVTLGGTGKEDGDRHPKISDNVLIGACTRILGNIRVGRSAQVAAGSLVLREVPPRMLVAGTPAIEIGEVIGTPALDMDQWASTTKQLLQSNLDNDPFATRGNGSGTSGSTSSRASQQQAHDQQPKEPGVVEEEEEDGHVDSVTTDREAQRRGWSKQAPPEFLI